jgi:hypothetical protein
VIANPFMKRCFIFIDKSFCIYDGHRHTRR